MLSKVLIGLALLGLIVWFFEIVLAQRKITVDVKETVG